MSLLQEAKKTEFKRLINGDLSAEHAIIIWTNFAGRPTKYVAQGGKRTFALVLTKEVAETLREEGWNVKSREPQDEQDDPLYFTEIVVNMDSKFPPKIVLYTEFRGRKVANRLNARTIQTLDEIDIDNVDLVIHPYEHGYSDVSKIKGYAHAIHVIQGQDANFGGKYADYEQSELLDRTPDDDEIPF